MTVYSKDNGDESVLVAVLSFYCFITLHLPETYVNKPKALVPSQGYHVVILNNVPVFRIVRQPCHTSGCLSPATHRGGWVSIPDQSLSDLWWRKYHRDRIFSEYFGFLLPISFHLCSVIIYSYITDVIWHKLTPSLKNTLENDPSGIDGRRLQEEA
jgi:hypothetical protein